jgi:hypothetical protein
MREEVGARERTGAKRAREEGSGESEDCARTEV